MISLLTPTRQRPQQATEFIESVLVNVSSHDQVEILLGVGQNDPCLADYSALSKTYATTVHLLESAQPDETVGEMLNELAAASTGDLLYLMNDDVRCQTQDWDRLLCEEFYTIFPDHIGVLFCDDLLNGSRKCWLPMIHRAWYETLGYFAPGLFRHFFNSNYLEDVAKKIDRLHYCSEVVMEHQHWLKTHTRDDTTTRTLQWLDEDTRTYKATSDRREQDAQKLLDYLQKQKEKETSL